MRSIVAIAIFMLFGTTFQEKFVYAGVVNIDFQPQNATLYTGTGAAPDAGYFWTEGNPGVPLLNLSFSDGTTSSGINIFTTFSSNESYQAYDMNQVVADGLLAASNLESVTITGLVANAFYNLYAYVGYYPNMFTVDGLGGFANGLAVYSYSWQAGNQYVLLSDAQADVNGMMTLQIERSSGNLATAIAGLQIDVDTAPPHTWCTMKYNPSSTNSDMRVTFEVRDGSAGTPRTGVSETILYVKAPDDSYFRDTGQSTTSFSFDKYGDIDYTPTGPDGLYAFALRSIDNGGNQEPFLVDPECTMFLDTINPSSTSLDVNQYSPASGATISFSVSDPAPSSGIQGTRLWYKKENTEMWTDTGLSVAGASGNFHFHPPDGEGMYHFYAVATDDAGNIEPVLLPPEVEASTYYEPNLPISSASSPPYDTEGGIIISFTASDDSSGLAEVALYSKFEDSEWVDTGLRSATLTGDFEFFPTQSDGRYYFYTRATDMAGNSEPMPVDDGDSLTIYDTEPPTSSASSPLYNNTGSILVSFSANDTTSGLEKVNLYYKKDDGSWTLADSALTGQFNFSPPDGEGIYYFTTRALDKAGLLESLSDFDKNGDSKTFFDTAPFDVTPPSVTLTYPSLVHYSNIDLYFSADDSEDGIFTTGVAEVNLYYKKEGGTWKQLGQSFFSETGAFRLYPYEGRGRYFFYGRARDNAGNWTPLPGSISNDFVDVIGLTDCDLDNDSDFDELDSALFIDALGSTPSDQNYNEQADINSDGFVSTEEHEICLLMLGAVNDCHSISTAPFVPVDLKLGTGDFSQDAETENWSVVCPAGFSLCPTVTGAAPADDFVTFSSGEYVVTYQKTVNGLADSCSYPLHVGAPGLRVELAWDDTETSESIDLDLHLHQPGTNGPWGGSQGNSEDCAYDNCTIDSFSAGEGVEWFSGTAPIEPASWYIAPVFEENTCYFTPRGDGERWQTNGKGCHNPRLDVDRITCDPMVTDPNNSSYCNNENINIDFPPLNEWTRIGVHYFSSHGAAGNSHPDVKIFCDGRLIADLGQTGFYEPEQPVAFTPSDSDTLFWLVADVRYTELSDGGNTCDVRPLYANEAERTPLLTTTAAVQSSFGPPYPPNMLAIAINILQILAGSTTDCLNCTTSIGNDGVFGLEEAIYSLQSASGL